MSFITTDVEDPPRLDFRQGLADEGFFRLKLGLVVLGRGREICAPSGAGVLRSRFIDALPKPPKQASEDEQRSVGVYELGPVGVRRDFFSSHPTWQRDRIQEWRGQSFQPATPLVDDFQFEAVAVGQQSGAKFESKMPMSQKGQQKCAKKLGVREPCGVPGLARLKGKRVHEDWLGATEENIVGGRIFEGVAHIERFLGEAQGKTGGRLEHVGGPFVGVARERNAFVLKDLVGVILETKIRVGKIGLGEAPRANKDTIGSPLLRYWRKQEVGTSGTRIRDNPENTVVALNQQAGRVAKRAGQRWVI